MIKFFLVGTTFIVVITAAIHIDSAKKAPIENTVAIPSSTVTKTGDKPPTQPTLDSTIPLSSSLETGNAQPTVDSIQTLMQKALLAKSNHEFTKSIKLYNQIITLLALSHDPEELQLYAQAHLLKASILEFNLHTPEDALATYDHLITKLKEYDTPELIKLTTKAQLYKASMVDQKQSLAIYNEIIERFKESSDPTHLHSYSLAQLAKSYMLSDEEAMGIYNEIIQTLSTYNEKPLLQQLYQAQSNKAYILEHSYSNTDAALKVYDEIIKQFSQYNDEEYRDHVESALFSKSFLLINTQHQAQAMQIFDDLIDYYQETHNGEVPSNFEYAILNNMELSVISGNDDTRYQELAQTYLQDSAEAQPQIEMLQILKNAQVINQDEALEAWQLKYPDFSFQNWSFEQLQTWSLQMEAPEVRDRLQNYLQFFENYNKNADIQDPYEGHYGESE